MSYENLTAFEITNFDGFYKSLTDEAFNDSAILVGKSFFRKSKSDINMFKKHVIDRKENLLPHEEFTLYEIEKCIFTTKEHDKSVFILPTDMEYVIEKISNKITYNIMSHLTDSKILEMCYSPEAEDIIWRIRK